jgi:hypothetical protein
MEAGATGPVGYYDATGPTGPTGPTFVMTIEQLMETQQNAQQMENADKAKLNVLLNPNTAGLTPMFLQWTSQGFPPLFVLHSMSLTPPGVCSDGTVRNIYDYASYLLEGDLSAKVQAFATNFSGMEMSYTTGGNTINIHVSKL